MSTASRTRSQRVAAYGFACSEGQILLARASGASNFPGTWFLPGGGVEHGEHPEETVRRELVEETGYACDVRELLAVLSDTFDVDHPVLEEIHTIRLVYRIELAEQQSSHPESGGSTDGFEWVPIDNAPAYRLAPFVRTILAEGLR